MMRERRGQAFPNRARAEVEAMPWPERIADWDGDRERELQRAYRRTAFWRMAWLFTVAALFTLALLYVLGVL